MNNHLSRDELVAALESDETPTLIEALPNSYYAAEHLPGAINIPHDEIQQRAATLVPKKSQPIVVYCANAQCNNSHMAAQSLRKMGYSAVYEYVEGKEDWKAAGLTLERDEGTS